MYVKWLKVNYMHCHISVYSKTTTEYFKHKTRITNIPLYFLLQRQFLEDYIKGDIKFLYFILTNSLLLVGF